MDFYHGYSSRAETSSHLISVLLIRNARRKKACLDETRCKKISGLGRIAVREKVREKSLSESPGDLQTRCAVTLKSSGAP